MPGRQTQQRIERGKQIIEHDAKATFDPLVELTYRRRFENIENPEQQEGSKLPQELLRNEIEHQHERGDLVPHHTAMIMHAEVTTGDLTDPDAEHKAHGNADQ